MPRIRLCLAVAALSLAACVSTPASTTAPPSSTAPKVSSFGKYSGYSEPVYDGWVRSSRYVTVRDGTRLAVDVFRPSLGGRWRRGSCRWCGPITGINRRPSICQPRSLGFPSAESHQPLPAGRGGGWERGAGGVRAPPKAGRLVRWRGGLAGQEC